MTVVVLLLHCCCIVVVGAFVIRFRVVVCYPPRLLLPIPNSAELSLIRPTLDTGHWTLDTGHWTLDTGHWTMQLTDNLHITSTEYVQWTTIGVVAAYIRAPY